MGIEKQSKGNKILKWILFFVILVFFALICWVIGKPMISFVSEPEKFRLWVNSRGIWGKVAFVGMVVFQMLLAIIPGEPLEIGAGYAFNAVEGTMLCLLGNLIGSIIIFLLVKKFGERIVKFFFSLEKLQNWKFLQDEDKVKRVTFCLFLIPGTPKDIMTYMVGLTPIKLHEWIFISVVARIPSVVTSTIGGNALGVQNYQFATMVFVITTLISIFGLVLCNIIVKKRKTMHERIRNGYISEKLNETKKISV